MSWLKTNNLARLNNRLSNRVPSGALLVVVIVMSTAPWSTSQVMQKGISVELAPTSSAVPVPDADSPDALIITVTDTGRTYLGIDPVMPDSLVEKLKRRPSHRAQSLYIKADARAPYASVVKVLDAARAAGVSAVALLTTQPTARQAGMLVSPQGIEMEMPRHSPATAK
jgi:biopolymer transport protein ExbD